MKSFFTANPSLWSDHSVRDSKPMDPLGGFSTNWQLLPIHGL